MQVSDLYMILRELQQVATLQSNLLDLFKADPALTGVYDLQQQSQTQLKEITHDYEQYNI